MTKKYPAIRVSWNLITHVVQAQYGAINRQLVLHTIESGRLTLGQIVPRIIACDCPHAFVKNQAVRHRNNKEQINQQPIFHICLLQGKVPLTDITESKNDQERKRDK